uniref:ATP-dependent Clp protease adaptor protein ClpS n=1 Tax=Cyanothece sp. (strain PCC 7425 / ATCC 29141) TaxID=395961 RepID=B8HXL0_CYAP4
MALFLGYVIICLIWGCLLSGFLWVFWLSYRVDRQRKEQLGFAEQVARIQQIFKTGGPRNRRDYFAIFPQACPRCGYRQLHTEPPLFGPRQQRVFLCSRCSYSNCAPLTSKLNSILRDVGSPYLTPEETQTMAELPYEQSESHSQIFVSHPGKSIEFLVTVLSQVFELPREVAFNTATETHRQGQGYVLTLRKAEAEEKINLALDMARKQGSPLRLTTAAPENSPTSIAATSTSG